MNKKPTLKEQVKYLEDQLQSLRDRHDAAITRNREREQRLSDLENQLKGLPGLFTRVRELEAALGPVWTTASGHKVTPKLMSDNHLEAALEHVREREARLMQPPFDYVNHPDEVFTLRDIAKAFEKEIARRAEDDHFHKLAGKVAPRVVIAKLSKWLRWLL